MQNLKQLKEDKLELQSEIETLVNKFRAKYENPKIDIFTVEVSGSAQYQIDIEVKL